MPMVFYTETERICVSKSSPRADTGSRAGVGSRARVIPVDNDHGTLNKDLGTIRLAAAYGIITYKS